MIVIKTIKSVIKSNAFNSYKTLYFFDWLLSHYIWACVYFGNSVNKIQQIANKMLKQFSQVTFKTLNKRDSCGQYINPHQFSLRKFHYILIKNSKLCTSIHVRSCQYWIPHNLFLYLRNVCKYSYYLQDIFNTFYYPYNIVIALWEFFLREVRKSTNPAWLPGQIHDM